MFKVGDKVSVISETIKGEVISLDGNQLVLRDLDGFERRYNQTEIAWLKSDSDYKLSETILNENIKEKIKVQLSENRKELRNFEVDLHIEELLEDHSNMTNHEILMKQMTICKQFIQRAIDSNLKRVVLIHGKGEGVLKTEIHLYLNKLSKFHEVNLQYHEASYSEYGMGGATEVEFG